MNIFRRSLPTMCKFSTTLNAQQVLRIHPTNLPKIDLTKKAGFSSEGNGDGFRNERPKLSLRRQNLPPYPHIDCVRELKVENYLPTSYKLVKYGEFEFLERLDGYVCVFIYAYMYAHDVNAKPGYAVYFHEDHPLNLQGGVERRQAIQHAKLYGFLKAMEQIPMDSFKKLCIMVDDLTLITFLKKSLRRMSENSFRSTYNGRMNKDLHTSMAVNKILRTREDLTLQLMWCPIYMGVDGIHYAMKMAQRAAITATENK